MNNSIIYALDFDGVICDSAVETAVTGWKAAGNIWNDMPKAVPQARIDQFRLIRPNIETGYEAILAMRLLYMGESIESIESGYSDNIQALLEEAQVTVGRPEKTVRGNPGCLDCQRLGRLGKHESVVCRRSDQVAETW